MKDKTTPKQAEITPVLMLGGRYWSMKVTHNVLQRFSAITRCNLMQMQQLLGRYDMACTFLWLILCETEKDLPRQKLDEWLSELPVFEALELVMENTAKAIRAAFPQEEEKDEDEDEENDTGEKAPDPTV